MPSRWGQGESALTATNSQHVFRSVAVDSTTGAYRWYAVVLQVGARQYNSPPLSCSRRAGAIMKGARAMREDSEEVIISRLWDNHGKEVGYEQKGVLVRCKGCKWWNKQGNSLQGRCELTHAYPTGAWYCADGARKEEQGNG